MSSYNEATVPGLIAQGGSDTLTFTNTCPRTIGAGQANVALDDIALTQTG